MASPSDRSPGRRSSLCLCPRISEPPRWNLRRPSDAPHLEAEHAEPLEPYHANMTRYSIWHESQRRMSSQTIVLLWYQNFRKFSEHLSFVIPLQYMQFPQMPYTQPTQHSHGAIPVGVEDPRCICLAICVQIRSHGHLSAECWAFSVSLTDLHWILTGICWVGSLHDGKHVKKRHINLQLARVFIFW